MYNKTKWEKRLVERPRTFLPQYNVDGSLTLVPAEGKVIVEGTPVNAENLNKIEEALFSLFTDYKIDHKRLDNISFLANGDGGFTQIPGTPFLLQWGKVIAPANQGWSSAKFPVEFNVECYALIPIVRYSGSASGNLYSICSSQPTKSSHVIYVRDAYSKGIPNVELQIYFIALGI